MARAGGASLKIGAAGVMLAYSCMSFLDAIGVIAERLRLNGTASTLLFAWFALFSLPSGIACAKFGSRRVSVAALVAPMPALVLLAFASTPTTVAAACLAVVGISNVAIQVAIPARVTALFGRSRQASVLTLGIFVKLLSAIALPFTIALFARLGCWRLFFPAFAAVFAAAAFLAYWRTEVECEWGLVPHNPVTISSVIGVARDLPTAIATLAFAVGVAADVAFNISVPHAVRERFASGDSAVAVVYAAFFGVKLPVVLAGAWLLARVGARRLFVPSVAISLVGCALLLFANGFTVYLTGVVIFAAGCANVYGFVFGIASPRHPPEMAAAVAALLVMSIAGGAVASPLVHALGALVPRAAEFVVTSAMVVLFVLSAFAVCLMRGKQ